MGSAELAEAAFAALARRDFDGFLDLMDPDVEFTSLILESEAKVYCGHAGVRQFLTLSADSAERYARLVAGRIHDGRRPTWQEIRRQLTTGWEMVSASVLPLVVMTAVYQLGAGLDTAILAALGCSTVLLCLAGWQMGRHGQLSTFERVASAAVAGAFGLFMVALKALLH